MKLRIWLLAAALGLGGCATVTRGMSEDLVIRSTPSGARVKLSNGQSCGRTPCTLRMARRSDVLVNISKRGCKTRQVHVTNRVDGVGGAAMAGNIVFGGIVGAGVDASTGATQMLVPNPVQVTLDCTAK